MELGCYSLFLEWFRGNGGELKTGGGIYSAALVTWLMIYQRLKEGASLSRAVEELDIGVIEDLSGGCKRSRENRISNNTGGYSQARKSLSVDAVREVTDDIYRWLREEPPQKQHKYGRPIFSIDGAVLELLHSKELAKAFPPFLRGHYPLMRILVCQDLATGLAIRPEWGAYAGKAQLSEVQLAKQMFARMPNDGIFIGDRNFGIFSIIHCAAKCNTDVIFRLTDDRAKKVLGRIPKHGIDELVLWKVSKHDRLKNPDLPQDETVKGRVICMNVQSHSGAKVTPLYLFTTLQNETASSIIEMYGLRWNVETDLRTLKQTVSMDILKVKSVDMAIKELFLGISAYNLVVSVRQLAAQRLNLPPRALSFKKILYIVDAYAPRFAVASPEQKATLIERFYNALPASKHPKRSKPRTEPRALVRHRRQKYPTLTTSRATAKQKLMKKN